jgi:glucosamine--fructose-6-phosphate aminotransferase (isomerizing)
MSQEIREQPAVWERLLTQGRAGIDEVAARIEAGSPRFVLFAARGTSDNAALYAKYLVEILLQLPAGSVSPSTMTSYGSRPKLQDVLLISVSQSGGSPDLVKSVEVAKECGALTLAVTNSAQSPLARAAELHVDILAGPERAVAATKSYTAQLLALYLLIDRLAGGDASAAADLPSLGREVLTQENDVARHAARYRFAQRLVVTGRGYSSATAQEAALKLMETSYVSAQAFSGADFMHGPVAVIDQSVPVIAINAPGIGGDAMSDVLSRLNDENADVLCIGRESAANPAWPVLALPGRTPEQVSPILEILLLQELALHLAVERGADPDAPRGLRKVTETL